MKSQCPLPYNLKSSQQVETIVAMAVYAGDNAIWITEAINSIIGQTYRQFLFVIVIDGDVSEVIAQSIENARACDERIVVLQNDKNIGLASSMNKAIALGLKHNAQYFVRMDADDISEQHRLQRQISYLKKHLNIHVLGSALTEINEQGVKVGSRVMPASHRQIVSILPRRCSMNHPTVVIRYKVFHDGHRYIDSLKNTQDYFMWINLAAEGYIFRNLKDKLLKFRRVNDFYKRRGLSKSINEFKARLLAITKLKQFSVYNIAYASSVLLLRLLPSWVVRLAYKLDRHLLERFGKH